MVVVIHLTDVGKKREREREMEIYIKNNKRVREMGGEKREFFLPSIVLPSLLITFDSDHRKSGRHPIIEEYDGFYDDDEEIELDKIRVAENANLSDGQGQQKESINQDK